MRYVKRTECAGDPTLPSQGREGWAPQFVSYAEGRASFQAPAPCHARSRAPGRAAGASDSIQFRATQPSQKARKAGPAGGQSVLLVRHHKAPLYRPAAGAMLVVILCRKDVTVRETYLVATYVATIYAGPRRGGARSLQLIKRPVVALPKELGILVKSHLRQLCFLEQNVPDVLQWRRAGIGPRSSKGTAVYKNRVLVPTSRPPIGQNNAYPRPSPVLRSKKSWRGSCCFRARGYGKRHHRGLGPFF